MKLSSGFAAITFIAGLLVGLPLSVTANENPFENLTFCSNKKTGVVRYTDGTKCKKKELKILIGMQGPQGPVGPEGPKGDPGPAGPPGESQAGSSFMNYSVTQSNGSALPWKLVDVQNDMMMLSFAYGLSGDGNLQVLRIFAFEGYRLSSFIRYSDSSCTTPVYLSSGYSSRSRLLELLKREMIVAKNNTGYAFVSGVNQNFTTTDENLYQLTIADETPVIYSCDSALKDNLIGISLSSLPNLSLPLKWVAND